MQTIIVTDTSYWDFLRDCSIVTAEDYLRGEVRLKKADRLINLCQSYDYQTIGYYVSLLGMAQDHEILPAIQSIQDCTNLELLQQVLAEADLDIQNLLRTYQGKTFSFNVYFGSCMQADLASIAKKIYDALPLPLFALTLVRKQSTWTVNKISVLAPQKIPAAESDFMQKMAQKYLENRRFGSGFSKKKPFFHLAVLTDPSEDCAPSDDIALKKFVEAGEQLDIRVDFIGKNDIKKLSEYAGLFLRAVPGIDDFTYRFMRCAEQKNLALIDDPQTLIKCNDKVYQAAAFRYHHIQTPHTTIVNKYQQEPISVSFPCVVKRPDNGFSRDILKADNETELKSALQKLFKYSDLLVIQSFIPTEFDWRIGVLDHKLLFASRYYMAKGHWQVINWGAVDDKDAEGKDESFDLDAVPEGVVRAALRACDLIGDGLYGVDIKSCDNEHYVIEVNSVPGICHGVEDRALGYDIYRQVMTVFLQRMQAKHGLLPAKPQYESWIASR